MSNPSRTGFVYPDTFAFKFRCNGCGEHDATTRYRGKDEDIVAWIQCAVQVDMSIAHRMLSPNCTSLSCNLMLPVDAHDDNIGMKRVIQ